MSPITQITRERRRGRDVLTIHCDTPKELAKLPKVLKELLSETNPRAAHHHLGEANASIPMAAVSAKTKELLITEPIRFVFRVLAGICLAFLIYWFGFR